MEGLAVLRSHPWLWFTILAFSFINICYGGAFISGVSLLLIPFVPSAAGAVILFSLEGFGLMVFMLIWEISMQELVPQEAFGRAASLDLLGPSPCCRSAIFWSAGWPI